VELIQARADVVGSLLRPAELLQARERLAAGEISPAQFKRVEDRAVDQALSMQERAGLEVLTDGELRRLSFQSQLAEAVEGFGDWDLDAFLWGRWHGQEGDVEIERPPLAVVAPLRQRRSPWAEELTYARARTERTVKVTIPSPSLFANFWDPRRSTGAYRNLEDLIGAVAEILAAAVDELVALGCTYVQIDAPHYTLLLDPAYRDFYESRGWPADRWLELGLHYDNLVIGDRPGVTFAFHLCRGNQLGRWLVAGGYDAIAPTVFRRVRAQRLMLEYDDERSGGFEPLAELPEDKVAVLGLVSTKRGEVESVQQLSARVREASRHCPLERLAISPQCGFATSLRGNPVTHEQQEAKLRALALAAQEIWG